jgi:hypothetical protein
MCILYATLGLLGMVSSSFVEKVHLTTNYVETVTASRKAEVEVKHNMEL